MWKPAEFRFFSGEVEALASSCSNVRRRCINSFVCPTAMRAAYSGSSRKPPAVSSAIREGGTAEEEDDEEEEANDDAVVLEAEMAVRGVGDAHADGEADDVSKWSVNPREMIAETDTRVTCSRNLLALHDSSVSING